MCVQVVDKGRGPFFGSVAALSSWPASGEAGGVVAIGVDRASGRLGDTFVPAGAP